MPDILAILGAVTALVIALTSLIVGISKIADLKLHINSRMDQMLQLQRGLSHAEGMRSAENAQAVKDAEWLKTEQKSPSRVTL